VAGDVFTAHSSANPKLLNGNKLCATPATYVVIWSPGEGELAINAYSGSKAPTGTDGLCASYFYQPPRTGDRRSGHGGIFVWTRTATTSRQCFRSW
jgi:hypothetical protein